MCSLLNIRFIVADSVEMLLFYNLHNPSEI